MITKKKDHSKVSKDNNSLMVASELLGFFFIIFFFYFFFSWGFRFVIFFSFSSKKQFFWSFVLMSSQQRTKKSWQITRTKRRAMRNKIAHDFISQFFLRNIFSKKKKKKQNRWQIFLFSFKKKLFGKTCL